MKWFKHDAHSLRKAAVERLIMEYGIEGYGLYYACMEMIAGDIATDDLTFELNHDAELIAHKFKMDTIRVEKIMHRCIELRLFELADSGKLRCMKLAQMLDETTSRNPEMCKLVKSMHESGAIRDIIPIKSGDSPSRREEKRLEEKRIDKRKPFTPPTVQEVQAYITAKNLCINPKSFHLYYTESGWKDKAGKPVSNWKLTAVSWHNREAKSQPSNKTYQQQLEELYPRSK